MKLFHHQNIIGLKLLIDDIQTSTDPKDADRNDILSDVNSACRTALDILNDLLCFDKLENGVLVLHRQEEPVLPFISNCVAMFSSQARECGVNLSIMNSDLQNHVDFALKATDMAMMDKFKMDQVLRNLISNALKFTPRGGTVTVSAAFVPNEKAIVLNSIHVTVDQVDQESDLEAMDMFQDSNSIMFRNRSFQNNFDRKKSENDVIIGKLVIVVSDSGVGLSIMNLKRLFKEVLNTFILI
jgi:signal transduction histidine kinase